MQLVLLGFVTCGWPAMIQGASCLIRNRRLPWNMDCTILALLQLLWWTALACVPVWL
jgi:hypothetical protein